MKRIVVLVLTVAMLTASASAIHPLALQSMQMEPEEDVAPADADSSSSAAPALIIAGALVAVLGIVLAVSAAGAKSTERTCEWESFYGQSYEVCEEKEVSDPDSARLAAGLVAIGLGTVLIAVGASR